MLFYHANCWDGAASAWVFSQYFGFDKVEYIPCTHGVLPYQIDEANNRHVFIVDFAFNEEVTIKLRQSAKQFILLDHHITAMQTIGHMDDCHFDMNHSGSMLMFNFLNETRCKGELLPPTALRYFEALDLYRSDEYNIDNFGSYLRQFDTPSIENVDKIMNSFDEAEIFRIGAQNKLVIDSIVDNAVKDSFILKINNQYVQCAFSPKKLMHEVAMACSVKDRHNHIGGACSISGDHVVISFRMKDISLGNDTLAVSQFLGGGGHKYASGARITFAEFCRMYYERVFVK